MTRIHAYEGGAERVTLTRDGDAYRARLVSEATRTADRCDGFHPMMGHSIAQTVMMKIEGVHMPRSGAHDLRRTPGSIYAVY